MKLDRIVREAELMGEATAYGQVIQLITEAETTMTIAEREQHTPLIRHILIYIYTKAGNNLRELNQLSKELEKDERQK